MDTTPAPQRAAVAIVNEHGYSLGWADEGIRGYTPTTYSYPTYAEARAAARLWNERAGLSEFQATKIVLSTMAGR